MKKQIGFLVGFIALFICSAAAYADMNISITDAEKDIVSISAESETAGNTSLIIFNPGKDETSIKENDYAQNSEAVQFFDSEYFSRNAEFTVRMNTASGGSFSVVMKTPAEKYTQTFEFYPASVKKEIIDFINGASGSAALTAMRESGSETELDRIMRVYSLYSYIPYASGNKTKIAESILSIRDSLNGKKYADDANIMYKYLMQACVLAAYNDSRETLIFDNNDFMYADILGLSGSDTLEDYNKSLSVDGRKKLTEKLLGKDFKTADEFIKSFNEEILYFGIKYYNKMGFGHLDYFFERYRSEYLSHGFNLNSLSSGTEIKNRVYSLFISKPADNVLQLAAAFNSAVDEVGKAQNNNQSMGGTGGTGGGGGGGSIKTGGLPAAPTNSVSEQVKENTAAFDDLKDVAWAEEAINSLTALGAVNGKSDRIFAPNDLIKRAEFVKILVLALGINTENASCDFEDVKNSWSSVYVAAAHNAGIVNGISDTLFGAENTILREEGAAMLYRAAQSMNTSAESEELFSDDGEISEYAREAVYTLKAKGIISGRGANEFAPKSGMTRAEAAKLIYQTINIIGSDVR